MTPREKLSCSYISSKRNQEDFVVRNDEQEFSMSEDDVTDFELEHSNLMDGSIDDFDYLVDANDLRRRLNRRDDSVGRSSHQHSPFRRYKKFKT